MNGRLISPAATFTGGGGVLPVWGEVAGFNGKHSRVPACTVAQSTPAPSNPCVLAGMNGLVVKMELGRPADGLTTHWIQFEAFSARAQDPWMYQLVFSPRSTSKRVNTSFMSSSERNVPYLMYAPPPPDSTGGAPVGGQWT